jgi:hypothetical protein
MNPHKILTQMCFKKTTFHKPGYNKETYESMMMPDDVEIKSEIKNGKQVRVEVKKVHPKSDSFWTLKYNDNYTFWCLVKNHQINKIWLENKSGKSLGKSRMFHYGGRQEDERLKLVFDAYNHDHSPILGKDQILNLLPKEVKRNFLLDQLFGS